MVLLKSREYFGKEAYGSSLISKFTFFAPKWTPTKLTPVILVQPIHEAFKQRSPVQMSDGETVNWQEAAGDLSCTDSNTNTGFHLEGKESALFHQAN